jgi:hypothetical protein
MGIRIMLKMWKLQRWWWRNKDRVIFSALAALLAAWLALVGWLTAVMVAAIDGL